MAGMRRGDHLVTGTFATGFYVIHRGSAVRVSPVFPLRSAARDWLATFSDAA